MTSGIFMLVILIFSVVIHEVAHGLAALSQGDKTAEYEGRLTLNPIKHMDLYGSVIVPLICYLLPGNLMFGWAKPVPYNPYNLRNGRWSEVFVAVAGPLSNILIALLASVVVRTVGSGLPAATVAILATIVAINLVLAVFNLVPLPPLDGSKIFMGIFPETYSKVRGWYDQYGLLATFIFIFFIWQFFTPVIAFLYRLFLGV
ncbi:MAG: site-2 protease family protein [Candidatus Taylorbacteria bacterium]|nr:site-2 protease family protein [Candidatus Taylorbacteria bacterium]